MVCAALAREAGFAVVALTIDYSQRHRVELEAARTRSPPSLPTGISCCRSIFARSAGRR